MCIHSACTDIQSALTIELITRHGYLLIICGLRPQSKVAQDENIQITIAELFDILPPCVISSFIVKISFIITILILINFLIMEKIFFYENSNLAGQPMYVLI